MRILERVRIFLRRDIWDDDLMRTLSRPKRIALLWLQKRILEAKLFFRNRIMQTAAALSFTTILSLIPLLAVLFMVLKIFDGREILESIKPSLYTLLTPRASDDFTNAIDTMLQSASVETLGFVGFIFLLGSVYFLFSSIEDALNKIWGVPANRKFVETLKTYSFLLFSVPLLLLLSYAVSSSVRELGENVVGGFSNFFGTTVFPFIMITLLFFLFLYIMPNCRVLARRAWIGAIAGTALFLISEEVFLYYTNLAVSTNLIYGSLAVLPIFFLWLYIAWMLVLYAVLIVYVRHNIEHLTALERSHDIGRNDEVHLGLMVALVFAQDSLVLHKEAAGLSATDIAAIIGAPPRDIREILSRLHKMHLIARVAGRDERFMLRVAPSQCTLGMVMNALDRAYLGINTYTGEKQFPIFSRLFAHNAFRLKSYRDISLLTVTEMNADILGKES